MIEDDNLKALKKLRGAAVKMRDSGLPAPEIIYNPDLIDQQPKPKKTYYPSCCPLFRKEKNGKK